MAHNVRVNKIPLTNKAGELNGKYRYDVKCKHRGCGSLGSFTGNAAAQAHRIGHHAEVKARYRAQNPNDRAHIRVHRNKADKAVKMVSPRG